MAIPNLYQVNDWMYRGGQPDLEGFQALQSMGIKTIISFRWIAEIKSKERVLADQLGFNYFTIPLGYCVYPSKKQVEQFFSIVDNPALRPLFVHCKYGSDRTGLMVAYFRMAREGWSADRAYEEMRNSGFHVLLVHPFKWAAFKFGKQLKDGSVPGPQS
jgi:protein tyrosine/serine phosphatase